MALLDVTPLTTELDCTMVFTDISASTALICRVGDRRWLDLLRSYNAHIEDLTAAAGGRVVKHLGDGHLLVFTDPVGAACAALHAQPLTCLPEIHVRVGAHCGRVFEDNADLVGLDVHIAKRLVERAAPHQLVLSAPLYDLVRPWLPTYGHDADLALRGIPDTVKVHVLPLLPPAPPADAAGRSIDCDPLSPIISGVEPRGREVLAGAAVAASGL